MIIVYVLMGIVALVLTILFWQQVRNTTIRATAFVADTIRMVFGLGVTGAAIGGVVVVALAELLTFSALVFLAYGLIAHQSWAVLVFGLNLSTAFLLVGMFARAVVGYFRAVANAGILAANAVLRVIGKFVTKLDKLQIPKVPSADAWIAYRMYAGVLVTLLVTAGLAPNPAFGTLTSLGFMAVTAFAVILLSVLLKFEATVGKAILVKVAVFGLLVASLAFALTVASGFVPGQTRKIVTACGAHPFACTSAVTTGQPFDAYQRVYESRRADEVRAIYQARLAEREDELIRHLNGRPGIGGPAMTPKRFAKERDRIRLREAQYLAALTNYKLPAQLSTGSRVELGAALAFWALLVGFMIWAVARIVSYQLWPSPATANAVGVGQTPTAGQEQTIVAHVPSRAARAYNWVALAILVLFVAGSVVAILYARRHHSSKPHAAKPRPAAAAPLASGSAPSATDEYIPSEPLPSAMPEAEARSFTPCPSAVEQSLCPEARTPRFASVSCGKRIARCHITAAREIAEQARRQYPMPGDQ